IAKRRDVLTGASEFPNLHEAEIAVLDATPVALPSYGEAKFKFDALAPMRLAAPFEALRDKSDEKLRASGARPRIFLANLGTAGVGDFIFAGSDALAMLQEAWRRMEQA